MPHPIARLLAVVLLLGGAALVGAEPEAPSRAGAATLGALGPADTWVLHYDPALADVLHPTIEDLLAAIPAACRIVIAVPSAREARTLTSLFDLTPEGRPGVEFLVAGTAISGWACDRYISFEGQGEPSLYVVAESDVPEGRRGDVLVAQALLERFPSRRRVESPLILEGGNCLLTDDHVFVGPQVLAQNLAPFHGDGQAILAEVGRLFAREVVLVGGGAAPVPHDHIDMYLTAVGPDTLLLGDPRLSRPYFDALGDLGVSDGMPNEFGCFRWETQLQWAERYDAVHEELVGLGFRVARIPILHSESELLLTWNNAVVETRAGRLRAYVPRYGIAFLDRLAEAAWRRLGCDVLPIRARLPIHQGGAVRCLSNVFRRAAPVPASPLPVRVAGGAR